MPKYSAFTPFGALAFSSKASRIETIYRALKANLQGPNGENYAISLGTNVESFIYARAREIARARYTLERAYNNANPLKATETLEDLEHEFQLIPAPTDGLPARRRALAARMELSTGATYSSITSALFTLLGSDFVAYRTTTNAEAVNFPATGGASPGNFVSPATTIKNIIITSCVSAGLGAPQSVAWSPFDSDSPVTLVTGDKLVVDPAIDGIGESVTISVATSSHFTATFAKPHDAGVFATTQSYPYWTSTKRFSLVVVSASAARNQDTVRKVHELMQRLARGVSTWAIVPDGGGGMTAAYTIGDPVLGRIGYAGIGAVAFP